MTETPPSLLVAPALEGLEHLARLSPLHERGAVVVMSLERTSGPEIIDDAAGTIVTAPDLRVQRWFRPFRSGSIGRSY
jgi:hypothetical protein